MSLDEVLDAHLDTPVPQRVLVFDIETAPLHSYHFRVWKEDIAPDQLQNRTWIICWSAKWAGQKTVHADTVTPEEALAEDDSRVVASLASLVREADVVVAHNLKGFDLKILNTRLLDLRQPPLPPVTMLDTLDSVKRNFKLEYNRLDYLARFLGLEPKHKMQMRDWILATKGDEKSLRKMTRYCKHDTQLLEDVLGIIRPYVKGLPRMVVGTRPFHKACPHCGSDDLNPTKDYRTKASDFPMFQCGNCQGFSRLRSSKQATRLALHPL